MKNHQRLIQLIYHGFRAYYKGDDQVQMKLIPLDYVNIVKHQNAIEWSNFVRGRVSKQFIIVVMNHYKEISYKQKQIVIDEDNDIDADQYAC